MTAQKGFTLIELLVVISIIAILSVVGLVVFQNAQKSAKDAKIKADLNAIKKAYETNYDPTLNGGQGGYKPLSPAHDGSSTYFADGKIPKKPDGTDYTFAYGPDVAPYDKADGYQISAKTSDEKTIYATSTQGSLASQGTLGTCDPGGDLSKGLLTYWKFDEGKDDVVANSSSAGSSKNGTWSGPDSHWATTQEAKIGNSAGKFSGTGSGDGSVPGNYVYFNPANNWPGITRDFSVSFWIFPTTNGGDYKRIIGGNQFYDRVQFFFTNYYNSVVFEMGNGTARISVPVDTNKWTFITVTFDGTTAKLSKDNTTSVSGTFSGTFNTNPTDDFVMGKANKGHSFAQAYFAGMLDDVRIYNRVLSDSEIKLLASGCSP